MDFKLTEAAIRSGNTIYEGGLEQPVDCEILLPDYCPDISRILKCQISPRTTSALPSGSKLALEGAAKIRVFYVSEDGIIQCYEQMSAFSAEVGTSADMNGASIRTGIKTGYVNCHAVSQRKIDVHGSFTVTVKATAISEMTAISDVMGENLQINKKTVNQSRYIGEVTKSFTVTETLELASGKPPIGMIIRSHANARLDDVKIIANKTIIKGEILIKTLYRTDRDIDSMEFSVPLSNIIDFDGVDDNCIVNMSVEVCDIDTVVKTDSDGEHRLIHAEIKLCAAARGYLNDELDVVKDMYSTDCMLNVTEKSIETESILNNLSDTFVAKDVFELPDEGAVRVIDIWSEPLSLSQQVENEEITLMGQNNICLLVEDSKNALAYYERASSFEYKVKTTSASRVKSDLTHTVLSTGFSLQSNSIEIRSEIFINGIIFAQENYRTVAEAVESDKIDKSKYSALTIYYADSGEHVWDIAKKYCTSKALIMDENELESENIEKGRMLLIPQC